MGANDYIISYREADQSKVTTLWEEQQEEDRYESGAGAYAGNSTTMHGRIRFQDKRFATENEAHEFILDKHEKREAPLGVSYYLPAEEGKNDETRKAKVEGNLITVEEKRLELIHKIQDAFINRKSKLVACKGCDSRISHTHLNGQLLRGQVIQGSQGGRKFYSFTREPTIPTCPVCKASLLSESDTKRIAAHGAKKVDAMKALTESKQPKPSKKLGWCVGGWAAS